MKNRIISLILAATLLFSLVSCRKSGEEMPPKDKNLTVETEPVVYSDEEIETAAKEIADVCSEIASLLGYSILASEESKAEIAALFKTDIMPVILGVSIHKSELSALVDCARKCIDVAENEYDVDDKTRIISELYTKFTSILDTDRLGALVYRLDMLYLEYRLERAERWYEEYGHPWLPDEIEHYQNLIKNAKNIDGSTFAEAMSVIMVLTSALVGSMDRDVGLIKISAGDLFGILEKHGRKISTVSLTGAEWQTVVMMCEDFIPSDESTLGGKIISVMSSESFFSEVATVLPSLIAFYSAVTADLSDENISVIENKSPRAIERVVCSELIKHRDMLEALLSEIELAIPEPSEDCLRAVNTYDKAGYETFVADYPCATAAELIDAMESFANFPTEENYTSLERLAFGYVASMNPVIAYVYLYI